MARKPYDITDTDFHEQFTDHRTIPTAPSALRVGDVILYPYISEDRYDKKKEFRPRTIIQIEPGLRAQSQYRVMFGEENFPRFLSPTQKFAKVVPRD